MKVCIAKYLYALIMVLVFTAATAFGQIKVVHFNAGWNEVNNVEWFSKISDADIDNISIPNCKIIKAQMNLDLITEDLKRKRTSNQSYWLIGSPEIEIIADETIELETKFKLEEFLKYDFFPRSGGGIGVTRLMKAMEANKLI